MAGAQNSMMEDASHIASRDQASLDQVQQTAAKGQEHVQGKLLHAPSNLETHAVAMETEGFMTLYEAVLILVCADGYCSSRKLHFLPFSKDFAKSLFVLAVMFELLNGREPAGFCRQQTEDIAALAGHVNQNAGSRYSISTEGKLLPLVM